MSNLQQNIELLQTPAMGVTINNKLTTTEPPPWSDSTKPINWLCKTPNKRIDKLVM